MQNHACLSATGMGSDRKLNLSQNSDPPESPPMTSEQEFFNVSRIGRR
jgi:hypothetical protein